MSNNKVPLKELCYKDEIGKYGIPASAEDYDILKTRYLRITDISDSGELLHDDKKSVTSDNIEKYLLKEGDIVFARTGNSTGRTYFHEEKNGKLAFAGFLIKYALDPNQVNPKYLKFFTLSSEYKTWVKNLSVGSTRGNINAQTFADCPITLPIREQQNLLVNTLSLLNDKIDLNNRINAELEAMAKTLYDYWFVQFDFPDENGKPYKSSGGKMEYNPTLKRSIPEGWGCSTLTEYGEFRNGINYDPSVGGDTIARIINVRDITKSTYFLNTHELDEIHLPLKDIKKYLVSDTSILITRSASPGATRLIENYEKNTIYCGFIICLDIFDLKMKYPLFFFLKNIEKIMTGQSSGTIMKNVSQETLKGLYLALPSNKSDPVISSFNGIISSAFLKMNRIQQENQQLTQLRDWLLPMLMNGQVKVA